MKCFIFAHRGEAQEFISFFKLKTDDQVFYTNQEICLLITGEGPYEVFTKLPYYVAKFNIKEIINYGIAGSLTQKIKLNEIIAVRTAYAFNQEAVFHSYPVNIENQKLDCITTFERVLNDEFANTLSHFAHIVDRELWAIAKISNQYKLKINCFKLISDHAGSNTECFDLKQRAEFFSKTMLQHYKEISSKKLDFISEQNQDDFKLPFKTSFTQNKAIHTLANKLNSPLNLLLKDFNDQDDLIPNANLFIEYLKNKLNPLRPIINKNLNDYSRGLTSIGAKVEFDRNLEKETFKLNFEINSQTNIEKLKNELENLNYSDFTNILSGDFDV